MGNLGFVCFFNQLCVIEVDFELSSQIFRGGFGL